MRAQFFRLAHITHTMVHPFLGQVLIRQEWEVSIPDVGLNKTLRIRPTPRAANSKADNTLLGKDSFLPQKLFLKKRNPWESFFSCKTLFLSKINFFTRKKNSNKLCFFKTWILLIRTMEVLGSKLFFFF